MFRFGKTLDPITLFHNPSLPSSIRVLNLLKQASIAASETATEDQASNYGAADISASKAQRGEFQLEVTTEPPTSDQLRNILEYASASAFGGGGAGGVAAGDVVKGAKDAEDAMRKFKEDRGRFVRPLTVDWTNGRAVVGDNASEILKMVRQIPADE